MTTAPRPHHASIALFLAAGLACGVLALLLGAAFAETPPPLAGSGSAMYDAAPMPDAISGGALGSGSGSGSAMAGSGSAATAPIALPVIDTEDPGGLARGIYDAALAGKYKIGVGFLLMLLVFVLRTYVLGAVAWFKTRVGGITLAVSTSVMAVLGLALAAGAPIQVGVILNAIGTALTAAGAWEWARDMLKSKTAAA